MADLTARPDHWTDSLPGNWQQAINTNGILNALGRALSRQAPDMTRGIEHDQYGSVSDRNWLLQQAAGGPPKMNPLAAEMLDKGGLLANFLGPGVKLPAAAPKPTGIRAYHGSPHDFEKFDINKIGTGEGAQAYGPGLYFAESEGVAKSYRDKLTGRTNFRRPSGDLWSADGLEHMNVRVLASRGDIDGAIAKAQEIVASGSPVADRAARDLRALLDLKSTGGIEKNPGRMYEVRINADPEQFLDWDKPFAQQSEGVKKNYLDALGRLGNPNPSGVEKSPFASSGEGLENLINAWSKYDREKARNALRDAGIPGVKYLDQMSRGKGEGSRNYAVWDDKLIEILRKYGLLPPVAAGTAAAINQQEPPL